MALDANATESSLQQQEFAAEDAVANAPRGPEPLAKRAKTAKRPAKVSTKAYDAEAAAINAECERRMQEIAEGQASTHAIKNRAP